MGNHRQQELDTFMQLETRNVFLDTEVLVAERFQFGAPKLKELKALIEKVSVTLLTTEIVIEETKKQAWKQVSKAKNILKTHQTELSVLTDTSLKVHTLFQFDKKAIAAEIQSQVEDFFNKATVCSIESVAVTDIFKAYFAEEPPFGPGQKKDQFPDAVTLMALSKWCHENDEKTYVVSADGDAVRFCEQHSRFVLVSTLAEFLDIVNRHEVLALVVENKLEPQFDSLRTWIEKQFPSCNFVLKDEEGEVEHVEVTNVSIFEPNIISLQDNCATVEVDCEVEFNALVHYIDYASSYYDREEGSNWIDPKDKSIPEVKQFEVTIKMSWTDATDDKAEVVFTFNQRQFGIRVRSSEWQRR